MTATRRWVADPSIGWRILLTASLAAPPDPDLLARSPYPVRTGPSLAGLHRLLVAPAVEPVVVGVAGRDLVVSAHHGSVDGLGLLRVLEQLGAGPATTSAKGVGDRPAGHGYAGTVGRRLAEALLRPPAPVPGARRGRDRTVPAAGDTMVELTVPGAFRTAHVVHAAVRALVGLGAGPRVVVAVGVSRDPAGAGPLADHSALVRLHDAERLDPAGVEEALRRAPVERPPVAGSGPVDRAAMLGMRLLSRRLGSTLLVSHLGEVTAPGVERLSFHPVTAGGSGVALGAVGHRGRTVLTLRARASAWDADGLERVLEAVGGELA